MQEKITLPGYKIPPHLQKYFRAKLDNCYVCHLVEICREVKRVLRKDGVFWINLGDSYAGSGGAGGDYDRTYNSPEAKILYMKGRNPNRKVSNLKPKDLCGIPWRVAFALQADGWWLRSDIIWCLSGGTKVYARTQKGDMPVTLKDLYRLNPQTIKLWNGKNWAQLKGMSKPVRKGNEIEIVLRSGERISCTPNHKWPTEKGPVLAKDLKCGDVLERCFLPESKNKYPHYIPPDIGWFIGLYIAEGSRDSSGTIQIASHTKENERFDRLARIAQCYDGTCRKHQISENSMTICMDGKILNAIIDTYVSGRTAKDKHLSTACWQRENLFLENLLMGYLGGDGHWDKANNRWRIGFTRNYNWESDLRTLCSRLHRNLTCKLSKSYIGSQKYDSFHGEIRQEFTAKGHWNQKNKGEIIEVRKARARCFYDIGVEGESHLFSLASGILTHNSKPNPMPESVTDRPTRSHEYVFLLTKSKNYYYDQDAVRESGQTYVRKAGGYNQDGQARPDGSMPYRGGGFAGKTTITHGRNRRSVFIIPKQYARLRQDLPMGVRKKLVAELSQRGIL